MIKCIFSKIKEMAVETLFPKLKELEIIIRTLSSHYLTLAHVLALFDNVVSEFPETSSPLSTKANIVENVHFSDHL